MTDSDSATESGEIDTGALDTLTAVRPNPLVASPDDDAVVIELRPRSERALPASLGPPSSRNSARLSRTGPKPSTELDSSDSNRPGPALSAAPREAHRPIEPEVEVNPRIAARRADVRTERRRRRLRRAALAGVPLLILCGLFALTRSSLLDVDRIDVRGAERTSRQAVLSTAGVDRGQPMTEVDLRGARQQVAELPWVAEVTVERRWPGRVQIDIVEREPVASLMGADNNWYLVDADGFATAQAQRPAPGLTQVPSYQRSVVVGEVIDRDGQALVTVASSLPPPIKRQTDQIMTSTEIGVELVIGRTRVFIGSADDFDAKITALYAVLDQVNLAGVCAIDVRVPNFPAVKRASCP